MEQLVTQNKKTVEERAQDDFGILLHGGIVHPAFAALETQLPILVPINTVVMMPERLINERIVHDQPDRAGELLPDCIVNSAALVE